MTEPEWPDPVPLNPEAIRLAALEALCREVGGMIGDMMPPGVGFMMMIFTLGEGGWMTYLSNAERDDMIRALTEFIEKQKAMPDDG